MAANPILDYFVQDASRLVGEVLMLMRVTGRMSALIAKGEAPESMGFNYQTVLYDRSTSADSAVWTSVQANSLQTPTTCDPAPLECAPANTVYNYQLIQTRLKSTELCMQDVRAGYNFEEQVMATRDNFKALIVDVWERQDKTAFFQLPGHKLTCNASLTDYFGQSDFGSSLPTSRLTAGILRYIYEAQVRAAGGEEKVAYVDAAPQFVFLCSPEAKGSVLQNDPTVREDIRFAQMGEGSDCWLLQSWNTDRSYAGFLLTCDPKMPRWTYNFGTGSYVEIPFYISVQTTNGYKLITNPAYQNAPYEDGYLWMKQNLSRDMPRPFGTGGADAKFTPVNFNGEIVWRNILEEDRNPLGLKGRWWAPLAAAYKPLKPDYAWVTRFLNCNIAYLLNCY